MQMQKSHLSSVVTIFPGAVEQLMVSFCICFAIFSFVAIRIKNLTFFFALHFVRCFQLVFVKEIEKVVARCYYIFLEEVVGCTADNYMSEKWHQHSHCSVRELLPVVFIIEVRVFDDSGQANAVFASWNVFQDLR